MFDLNNVKTAVEADKCELHVFGYFANDIASLRQTVTKRKVSLNTVYSCLDGINADKFERRFSCPNGSFSLFYPMDKTEISSRY